MQILIVFFCFSRFWHICQSSIGERFYFYLFCLPLWARVNIQQVMKLACPNIQFNPLELTRLGVLGFEIFLAQSVEKWSLIYFVKIIIFVQI